MFITSNFDSGNIEIVSASDPSDIRLKIQHDTLSDFYQWFHFRLSGVQDTPCKLTIENAAGAAYAEGWDNYSVCVSDDRENWHRLDTEYKDGALSWEITPDIDSLYFAYFAPYSMEQHLDLIAMASSSPLVTSSVLGHTLDGQAMDLLELGTGKKTIWLIARQHPGETMAEYWMEGAIERLLDMDDAVSRGLLGKATIYIVPNMNPDGSRRGHLRTNAAGINLNRAWAEPSMETSPEVYLVREKMLETGVDIHMDVHGDEDLSYNFIAGFEGIPSLTKDQLSRLHDFTDILERICPDFQTKFGYDIDPPKSADLKKCTDYVAETFGCLAMTLEMPFKDNDDLPDLEFGWSPERCRNLGRACIDALYQSLKD